MKPKDHQNPESVVREIKRQTRRKFSAEEKIRIILEGLKGEESIATICRRDGIAPNHVLQVEQGVFGGTQTPIAGGYYPGGK